MTKQTELAQGVEQEVPAQPVSDPAVPGEETDWAGIGQHFWVLGESVTNALKAAWQHGENQQELTGLQGVVEQVGQTVKEVAESPQFQPVQAAGKRTFHEVQPYLLSGLRYLRIGVDKLISTLEEPAADADEAAEEEVIP